MTAGYPKKVGNPRLPRLIKTGLDWSPLGGAISSGSTFVDPVHYSTMISNSERIFSLAATEVIFCGDASWEPGRVSP